MTQNSDPINIFVVCSINCIGDLVVSPTSYTVQSSNACQPRDLKNATIGPIIRKKHFFYLNLFPFNLMNLMIHF